MSRRDVRDRSEANSEPRKLLDAIAAECRRTLELDASPFYGPRIIDGPGEYRTRNGRRVTIHRLQLPPFYAPGSMCFPAKGSVWMKRTWSANPPYCIWRLDGFVLASGDHPWDIVGRWPALSSTTQPFPIERAEK